MKCLVSFVCALSVLVALSQAAPTPAESSFSASASVQAGNGQPSQQGLSNILESIDLPGLLRGVNSFVGIIRQFCPPLSQILDNVIQNVTSTAFRVFGRAILQNGGLGGAGGGGGGGGANVNVVLPTFPPDEDYDEEEDNETNSDASKSSVDTSTQISSDSATTSTPVSPANEENAISKRHVRVARAAEAEEAEEEEEEEDQEAAGSAPHPVGDLSNVDVDDQDRNKRFLPFGGGDNHGASGGGSGNFLFDIIRLVAGSGATEESDEKENGPGGVAELDVGKGIDGSAEGIPGPITRLFVIANRGIANLVQDLILRLAQTSERLVNFKARVVTALI